jgi:hypothetical protein
MVCEFPYYRDEIKVTVRDMYGEDSIGSQMIKVERK